MAKDRFNIKGTKDFLVVAVFCGFVCVWSIRDAWFPTEKILKKHPQEIEVAFKVSGVVQHIGVNPGDEVEGGEILASLYDESYKATVADAEAAFEAAKVAKSADAEEKLEELIKAKADVEACSLKSTDITWMSTHGEEALRGRVCRVIGEVSKHVQVGEPILTITPKDTFYQFNKTLSVLAFVGMIIALAFHRIASR